MRLLRRPFLGVEIDVNDAEPITKAGRPLEIVHHAPQEISVDRDAAISWSTALSAVPTARAATSTGTSGFRATRAATLAIAGDRVDPGRQADRPHPSAGVTANLCFGGPKRNRLFMAASQSLYAIYLSTQGAAPG